MDYESQIKAFGLIFKDEAQKCGLSQAELAKLANVTQPSVSRVFKGKQDAVFVKIMFALGYRICRGIEAQPLIEGGATLDEELKASYLNQIRNLEERVLGLEADKARLLEQLKKTEVDLELAQSKHLQQNGL